MRSQTSRRIAAFLHARAQHRRRGFEMELAAEPVEARLEVAAVVLVVVELVLA
jgi:hypothetical protein